MVEIFSVVLHQILESEDQDLGQGMNSNKKL